MATNNQDLRDANDLLREQLELLKQVNDLQQNSYDVSTAAVDSIKEAMGINSRRSTFEDATLRTNKSISQAILDQKTGLRDLESIGRQISKNQELLNKAKIIERGLTNNLVGNDLTRLDQFIKTYQAQQKLVHELETAHNLSLSEIQNKQQSIRANDDLLDQLTQQMSVQELQLAYTKLNTSELEKQQALRQNEEGIQQQLESQLGLVGKIAKTLGHFRGIADDVHKALKDTTEEMQRMATENGKVLNRWQSFGLLVGNLGKNLSAHLSDPLTTITTMVKVFKIMVEAGFAADTQVTNLSKSLATSKDAADALRDRYVAIQNSGESIFETTKNLVEAQLQLADAFGTSRGFTEQQVRDQVKLTKQIGLEEEAADGLQQLMLKNGQTADQATMSIVKQTASLSKQTGIQLNNKKILSDVAKVNGQLRLQYGNNTDQLAEAVIQSNKLGLSLEQSKEIAESLLNFESSIEAELSAELLTGRDLNLERARLLALNGKSAEAVKEMASAMGSAAEFSDMNVIAQESLAKAVGMNADELANSLVFQENLNKLGDVARKQLEDKVNELKKAGQIDEANRLMAAAGDADLAQAALKRVDAQTQFNTAIERLQGIVGSFLEGPGKGLVDMLAKAAESTTLIYTVFGGIAGLMAGKLLMGLREMIVLLKAARSISIAKAIADTASAIALTGGLGAIPIMAAIGATAGAIYGLTKGDDVVSPGEGTGYGNRTLLMGKDAIQLNNQDTVIAGTGLFKGNSNNTTTTDNSALISEIRAMRTELNNRPVVVHSIVKTENNDVLASATNSSNRKSYSIQ